MPMTARKLLQQTQFGLGSRSAMQLQAGKREEDLNFIPTLDLHVFFGLGFKVEFGLKLLGFCLSPTATANSLKVSRQYI